MTSLQTSPRPAAIDAAQAALDQEMPAAETGATGGDWAICCSGGGLRSAAYCLGALQSLDRGGLLRTAKWIVGVSGGSYIASSRALVAHGLPPGSVPSAYAPGTAEERNLRDNTRYIAPNGATLAVPPLVSWLTHGTGSFGTVARALGFGVRPAWSAATVAGLVGARRSPSSARRDWANGMR